MLYSLGSKNIIIIIIVYFFISLLFSFIHSY
jgi:hypothetical protein